VGNACLVSSLGVQVEGTILQEETARAFSHG
jgi:hypothetical protein